MNTTLSDFLTYFGLDDLLELSADTPVIEFLGLVLVAFFGLIFCVLGIRVVVEFIKIMTDYRRWR